VNETAAMNKVSCLCALRFICILLVRIADSFSLQHRFLNSNRQVVHESKCRLENNINFVEVKLDRPILDSLLVDDRGLSMCKSIFGMLLSDVCRAAVIAFGISFVISIVPFQRIIRNVIDCMKKNVKRFQRGIPMEYNGEGGWGVCCLSKKKKIGKSDYVEYEFNLPSSKNILGLGLGQELTMCFLTKDDDVVKGEFHPWSSKVGSFSVVLPNIHNNNIDLDEQTCNFIKNFEGELDCLEEIAIKPGQNNLKYRGPHMPVTDMVYVAYGLGIIPMIDMIKAVLPSRSSSVESASVLWMNDDLSKFDLAYGELEKLYKNHKRKLDVSCVLVDNFETNNITANEEIEEAIPTFSEKTMAIVAGPIFMVEKMKLYLQSRKYPEDCICSL